MSDTLTEVEPTELAPQQPQPDYDIDAFLEKRAEFIEKVNKIMVESKDYHVIQGRKSMAKGGAEKIASIFGWTARYEKDADAMEAFKDTPGLICYVCNLEKAGAYVGQGRGAATLKNNGGDPNKTIKMAQKSAFIDAVIRASGLSDFYTQDLGPDDEGSKYGHLKDQGDIPASEKQLQLIADLMKQKGYEKTDVIDAGFTKLTGGKEGTASELIDWLMKAPQKSISEATEPSLAVVDPETPATSLSHELPGDVPDAVQQTFPSAEIAGSEPDSPAKASLREKWGSRAA